MENTDFLDSFIKKAKFFGRVLRQLKPDRYGKAPLVGGLIGASTGALMGAAGHAENKALLNRQIERAKSKKEKDRLRTAIKNQSLPKSMLAGAVLMGGLGGALGAKAQREVLKSRIHDVNMMRTLKGKARARHRAWSKSHKEWRDGFRGSRGGNPFRRPADPGTAKSFFGIGDAKTKAEVAKAYKAMAKKHHPDAGGSGEKMKEINKHYDDIKNSDWFGKLAFIAGFEKKQEVTMNSFKDIWLEKVAAEVPEHKHPEYAKKEHKHDQYATKKDAKDIAEDVVEDHKEELHKDAAMNLSEVKNNPKPVLVVGYAESDEISKNFIQRLDKVLTSMSGIDRLQIKALNLMKDRGTADQLKVGKGVTLYKGGKVLGELSIKAQENDIRKFMESHRKDFI